MDCLQYWKLRESGGTVSGNARFWDVSNQRWMLALVEEKEEKMDLRARRRRIFDSQDDEGEGKGKKEGRGEEVSEEEE